MVMEFEIQKGVPAPERAKHGRREKYPFRKMEVGDSILIPGEDSSHKSGRAARKYGAENGKRFCTRSEPAGLRIWRIE